ncbi:MAG: hypothetical protein AAGE94_09545 [Acidobacteriota bacterium]
MDDTLFFSAFDDRHGRELWKVKAGVVSLVKDIHPGSDGSTPANLRAMGSLLAFSALTADDGRELAISDGSADGTKTYDLNRGDGNSNPRPLGAIEDRLLYVEASTDDFGSELWAFSPSSGDFARLTDGQSGSGSSYPRLPLMRDRDLVFVMDTDSGTGIYESISGGAASFLAAGFGSVEQLIGYGDEIMYISDGDLRITDNSPDGSRRLPGRDPFDAGSPDPVFLFQHQGYVFYFTEDGLWRSDGTADGTEVFHACECEPKWIQEVGDSVYFSLDDQETGREVWWLQGGTLEQIADLERDTGNSKPADFTEAGGHLYFSAAGDAVGREIFGWDSEAPTASLVDDLRAGSFDSFPRYFTTVGESLYLVGFGDATRLYRIEDPEEGGVEVAGHSGNPVGVLDGELYTRQSIDSSRQLFKVSGLAATQLSAFAPPDSGVDFNPGATLGDDLYFRAAVDPANLGSELWRTDGTSVELAEDVLPGFPSTSPSNLHAFGGGLFFEGRLMSSNFRGLWWTDGSMAGAEELAEVQIRSFFSLGGQLFFVGFEDVYGQEIWTSDGTPDGTSVFIDLVPGSEPGVPSTGPVAVTESRFFFQAYQPGSGRELWVSDGTVEGTRMVRDIVPGILSSQPTQITAVPGDEVVFTAWSADLGWELWRSDGTALGTHRVADIFEGTESSEPTEMVVYGDWVVFAADSAEGREPWAYRWTDQPVLFTDGFERGNTSAWSSGR